MSKKTKSIILSTGNPSHLNIARVGTFDEAIADYITNCQPTEYSLVFAHSHLYDDSPRHALCVRKKAGSLHEGCLNLPGGKLHKGETPQAGSLRELKEETGCEGTFPQRIGAIIPGPLDILNGGKHFLVHIVRVMLAPQQTVSFPADQPADWYPIKYACDHHHNFVPNLATILPLCAAGMFGFIIQDNLWIGRKSITTVTYLPHDIVAATGVKRKASFTA